MHIQCPTCMNRPDVVVRYAGQSDESILSVLRYIVRLIGAIGHTSDVGND